MSKSIQIFILTFITSQIVLGQTIDKSFSGCWGETTWTHIFDRKGNYTRLTYGHYGNTTIKAKYQIKNDTIQILYNSKKSPKTIREQFLIDENSILIDTELGYGYQPLVGNHNETYLECEIKYPKIQAVKETQISDVETVLNMAFNSPLIKKYYHFDKFVDRRFLIAQYFKLKANIEVDGRKAIFEKKEKITDFFYIDIEEISIGYSSIFFTIHIIGENIKLDCWYKFEDSKWVEKTIRILE